MANLFKRELPFPMDPQPASPFRATNSTTDTNG